MRYALLVAVFAAASALPGAEDDLPRTSPPKIVVVRPSPNGVPVVDYPVIQYAPATRVEQVRVGDTVQERKVEYECANTTGIVLELDGKNFDVFGVDGKKIEPGEVRRMIKCPIPALVSTDTFNPLDPFFLKLAREGTLVLVPMAYFSPVQLPKSSLDLDLRHSLTYLPISGVTPQSVRPCSM
jgi:hypothetical protein